MIAAPLKVTSTGRETTVAHDTALAADTPPPAPMGERHGPLRNGNRRGDPNSAPRCAARTRAGTACRSPAMVNGRCRMHGGASTGARTAAGRAVLSRAAWKHGCLSAATRAHHEAVRRTREDLETLVAAFAARLVSERRNRKGARKCLDRPLRPKSAEQG